MNRYCFRALLFHCVTTAFQASCHGIRHCRLLLLAGGLCLLGRRRILPSALPAASHCARPGVVHHPADHRAARGTALQAPILGRRLQEVNWTKVLLRIARPEPYQVVERVVIRL